MSAQSTSLTHRLRQRLARVLCRVWSYLAGQWKRLLLSLAIVLVVLGGGGFLVAWLGLISISASSGHWGITYTVLQFAMHNAVETQSMTVKPADLSDPTLVLKAAGHYATGCEVCHGAPGESRSLIAKQMTPEPPTLAPKIKEWSPEQLFWIVKHGVKYTAMPAWVSQERDDEVWAMVAFLQELPSLSPEQYRQLAYGELADEDAAATVRSSAVPDQNPLHPTLADCARCHGADGNGRGQGAFPKLAGQSYNYLRASLQAYASSERHSGIMQPIAADLSETSIEALAQYYADQPRLAGPGAGSDPQDSGQASAADESDSNPAAEQGAANTRTDAIASGEHLAAVGVPQEGIPSCTDCHGPGDSRRNPFYPELDGQYASYLELQLTLFKSGKRGGTPYADIMHMAAKELTARQIQDLALYYESLGERP